MSSRSRIIPVALLLLIPLLIFWMWLLSKAIRSSWLCPRECWCDPEEDILYCSHASLKELPQIYHNPLYELYLHHNNFSILAKKAFVSKSILQIESLYLGYCEISYIDVDAFNGLVLLDYLSLVNNLLTGLRVGTFKNMTHLQSLHLAYNRIENLEAGIFEGLTSLEWLNLAHNLLYSLGSGTFIGLTNLKNIFLSHNRLSTLHPDVFMHLTKLNALYLDENKELQIPSNSSFLNIQTVEELDISDCNISRVMPISFENATNLTKLILSNNNLKTIDDKIFRGMLKLTYIYIYLYGNPLECDCGLLNVWRWCQEHGIEVVEYVEHFVLCESPDQVSGLWWGVLGKAQCKRLKVGTFKNMTHLQSLHLAYNRIENLEAEIFEGLTSLEWLNLAHNLLYSLRSDVFIGLNNLKNLFLSHNRLSTLHPDVFMHLTKLNALYLDENEELQIPSNSSFLNIQTVEFLRISDCNVSSVTPISFENATNLTRLVLSNNNLKTIDYNIFRVMPKLTRLFLEGNPLECDCGLLKLWRWCQEHGIEVVEYVEHFVLCESPEQVSGLWWGVLGKAQCKNGSIMFEEDYNSVVPNDQEEEEDAATSSEIRTAGRTATVICWITDSAVLEDCVSQSCTVTIECHFDPG
ncbi:insulin-like growth factor-binding protein complex acid labile subunit [Periplaneta americana]|uniref:insulin-like growth factor-binding protein complex acid labile subunit n=1 Tax=Periplaneta americana TaxID=6978 RepID=UPI0037E89542